jgi:hypothetical protein
MNWTESPHSMSIRGQTPPVGGCADVVQTFRSQVAAARELLARTAELPSSKRELLTILNEYRAALFAFAVENDDPRRGRRRAALTCRVDVLRMHPALICEMARVSAGGTAP